MYSGTQGIQYYQAKHGYTGYIGCIQGIQYDWGKHGYTRYIGVYKVYNMTEVNMGTQDIQGYTVLLRVHMGTQDIQGYTRYTV